MMDRARIQVGLKQGLAQREIAAMIGVNPSTVSREIARSSVAHRKERIYDAEIADYQAMRRRERPKQGKLEENLQLRQTVIDSLNKKYSPEQIAGRLPVLFPDDPEMRVSHETIYQALYVQGKGALRHELTVEKALRSGRTSRKPRSKLPARSNRSWLAGSHITDRPAEAEDRAVPGHWEGDLVVGPGNSGIITIVERAKRFTLIGRLPGTRDSVTVTDRLAEMIKDLPESLLRSLTWDQGQEMARHKAFTAATGLEVFFCDPHSPWQRGTNENTNGLIREFFPKGTNFNNISDDEIAQAQDLLNGRPRKALNFYTPAETLNQYLQDIALTE